MKNILTILTLFVLFFYSSDLNAQQQKYTVDIHGGYSWLDGVVGVDFQLSHIGFSVGWMPTKMPLTGQKINSIGVSATYYSAAPDDFGWYASIGSASAGYRSEYSGYYGNGNDVLPMTIVMIGLKSGGPVSYFKLGGGYGWASNNASSWAFEATFGYHIFSKL